MNTASGISGNFWLYCIILLVLGLFWGCEDTTYQPLYYGYPNDGEPIDTLGPPPQGILDTLDMYLVFDYWNPTGIDPHIMIDTAASSDKIKIGDNVLRRPPIVGKPNVTFLLEDIQIDYSPVHSRMLNLWSEELYPDGWRQTSEYMVEKQDITKLDIALVLDVSKSLGSDVYWVKEYAKAFAAIVKQETKNEIPRVNIAVVGFSTLINYQMLESDQTLICNFIDGLNQGEYTALFAAMNTGINLLAQEEANYRSMVTFTDGNDNYSHPVTRDYLLDKFSDPGFSNPKVRSFLLGFRGRDLLDDEVLKSLAVNNGKAVFTRSVNQLRHLFEKIARDICRSVNLTYTRNDQIVPEAEKRRVRVGIRYEVEIFL